jgi:Contractile injection system tube protein
VASNLFKLEKLKIFAFVDVERTRRATVPTFEAMFNPASIEQSYCIPWGKRRGMNESGAELQYAGSNPAELRLVLVFDGTGVDTIGIAALPRKSVATRVDELFAVAHRYNGAIHQPNYLRAMWGELSFDGRLANVDVKYTSFDRDGTPLRAELTVKLLADISAEKLAKLENKQSPDVTHERVVRSGDTLPLLTKEVYGSATPYLLVARWNGLDDFRRLTPGARIEFPPLAELTGSAGAPAGG